MAFLLVSSCLIVLFFVLPKETCSFNLTQPCQNNETCLPFSTANSIELSSVEYIVRCNHSELEIRFEDGSWRTVKEIDCIQKKVTVLDQELGNILDPVNCNFLYMFDPPFHHFVPPHPNQFKNRTTCSFQDHQYFQSFLPEFFNLLPCRNYSAYYWNRWKSNLSDFSSAMCEVNIPHPPLEFVLSFSDGNKPLSLLSFGFSAHLKLLQQCFNDKNCKESSKTGLIIGLSTAGGFSFIMFCSLCFLIYRRWKKKQSSSTSNFLDRSPSSAMSSKTDPELGSSVYTPIFSYDELYEATNAFDASKELGDGGFGTVYKGKLKDGRVVAVKRLYETNYRRAEQFMNEVKIVSLLRHQNLVSLYGCTSRHSRELLLVYEFIPNGTVADHLHGSRASESFLPWNVRMNIAIETADALNYLHSVEPQIIHRDIKTNNIMLDNSFHVKVGDFGLSRLFPLDATHVSTAPQGTPGYVDPEYHKFFQLTDKSDVYSFGVVLMELISSMPAVDINRKFNEANLAYMAIKKIQRQELHELVDPRLGFHTDSNINSMISQVAELALQCLQSEREMRPAIKVVLEVLREIEKAGFKSGDCMEVADAVKEEACLLKNIPPYSPNSVADRWISISSSISSFSG
ncbi:LEAF RUST 10 DISEASE-RESISTANCE LOCUS RECEPTOR-LIKE PROTEIN KINASE-like 1.2 isoform X2 [Dendrobium catenatum]|uniref:LEAF RUST 10 DISEASE-RESISTANCE LOCUS RECEPTOR-LIKE PROTEIN KINASE-like 1.2 isoform X2 n=1 Tax=Dendrobium catenatum TaxID=906689 RepID=UPI0010A04317|nr:LEAF RUST 10 DISEASE-RESISTANCE LOCUS RECEPTOR-LIKE PROTEIN KINASE-like 1.2 isoform X2 [Dendrobium catenatum]